MAVYTKSVRQTHTNAHKLNPNLNATIGGIRDA